MRHSGEQIDLIEAIANTIIYIRWTFSSSVDYMSGSGVIWVFEHP